MNGNMDNQQLVSLFQGTLDPNLRIEAEKKLEEISHFPGFSAVLLQMVMTQEIQIPIRQAAVIYLKNMISHHWVKRNEDLYPVGHLPYVIPDEDKHTLKENIVEATTHAAEQIRVQLTVCIAEILSCDFPDNWPSLIPKLHGYITSENQTTWLGGLTVLHQVTKKYEYKNKTDRGPVLKVMEMFLPILHSRCVGLMKDDTAESCTIQAKILKIFKSLIQLHLPLELINQNNFPQWMGILKTIMERPVPEAAKSWDEDEQPSPWWKCKKWAVTVLFRIFERYGCPGGVGEEYAAFADFYDKHFSESVMESMLKILDLHRRKEYVSPRVLQQVFNYLHQGVANARSWKVMRPHVQTIIREIIFPLMCHNKEDEELWNEDPHEYIKVKNDLFEDFLYISPNAAAKNLLIEVNTKRKGVLEPTIQFIMEILTANPPDPMKKDGALHMLGALAKKLSKRKEYRNNMEIVLVRHIFPEFQSEFGFLRARANWVVQHFSVSPFNDIEILAQTVNHVMNSLCNDKELPVQVDAGIAISHILERDEEGVMAAIKPHVRNIVEKLLILLRETHTDELAGTISKMVENFGDDISSIAFELTSTLCKTFLELVESEEDYDSKSVTAVGVLETIGCIVGELDQEEEIMSQLEELVSQLIVTVLQKEYMEFYEDTFTILSECTSVKISPRMWQLLQLVYETFQRDTIDYFTEMMPCLHNYATVDAPGFLANPRNIEIMYEMAKKVLESTTGEDPGEQAAKLIEVIILQHRDGISQWLPAFMMLALERLTREVKTSEFRVLLLQVVIAALYTNGPLALGVLEKTQFPSASEPITAQFITQWLKDTDCFLGMHDRKAFVLGMCSLLSIPSGERPQAVNALAQQYLQSLITIFKGLKEGYDEITAADEEDKDEEGGDELESSDDEYDEDGAEYVDMLQKQIESKSSGLKFFGDSDDLEIFTTPIDDNPYIDEYITFRDTLQGLQTKDAQFYEVMVTSLSPEQHGEIQEIINEANRRQKANESRKYEEQGGYKFTLADLPAKFSFGGSQ
ncbi:importin-7-like [Rhopilema esculentum]|uniref:importin-7-like n=1 Tax=Rhopilema esculentum TaxID=499914 RepID=UPI0031DB784E